MPGGEYEFDASDNEHFVNLASAMRFVGIGTVIIGLLLAAVSALLFTALGHGRLATAAIAPEGIASFLFVIIGVLNARAATPFRQIHDTAGRDISNLMEAFTRMRALFRLLAVLLVLMVLANVAFSVLVWQAGHVAGGAP
jgi:hypothetical protein